MIHLPGYYILEKLIEEESYNLYKAYSAERNKMVGLKVINSNDKDAQIAGAIHDYYMSNNLAENSVLKALKLENHGDKVYIVTELYRGQTIRKWLENGLPNIERFLHISLTISDVLAMIHQEHIILKSLQPQNILIDSNSKSIKITGFNEATRLSSELQQPYIASYDIKEQISYWSPEQTGRMNHPLDYRTDLYSLGIIFYEMLTGSVPFTMESHAEMVHAHLAITPKSPHEINETVSLQVSNIVMKLLEKSPQKRYQSVYGLIQDLEKCVEQLQKEKQISLFNLGEYDVIGMFEKPNKLFGREQEISQLLNEYEHFKKGSNRLLLLSGSSGVGKTALVNELHKLLIQEKGYYISGKFTQLQKDTPYAPLVQAFQELIKQILSEGTENTEKWANILSTELASYTEVIAEFIPEIEWIIGEQANVVDLPPEGVHNRFLFAVKSFVHVFARKEHPLVLFLDDLQWADQGTIDLLQYLLQNAESNYLLIIGAYREDEVSIGHPFEIMLNQIKEKVTISVKPLEFLDVLEWINLVFSLEEDEASVLCEVVYRITHGKPFFIVQLLQLFYDEEIVSFQSHTGKWQVNMNQLQNLSITDTIIPYILNRLDKLSNETKEILQLASCLGNSFDLRMLSIIAKDSYAGTARKLWSALEEGVIIPLDSRYKWIYPDENIPFLSTKPPTYRFFHDNVLQAIYMTMSIEQQEKYHLQIGNILLVSSGNEKYDEHIFDIVKHLNIARHHLNFDQQLALADWNRIAGEKAKASAALDAALNFFTIGKELLPVSIWDAQYYETTIKIMTGLGETQYLTKDFVEAEKTFETILVHARTLKDKARIYNLKITLYTHIHQVEKAMNAGLEGVSLFKWRIKTNPKRWEVAKEYLLTKRALGNRKGESLLQLPQVQEENSRMAMEILINTNASAYHVDQNLATIIMLRALRLTLKHGDMDVTALVYNNYALTLSAGFNDYEGSYQFGELAIAHAEKYGDTALKARVYFVFGSFVNHWKRHIRYNIDYLEQSQQMSIESGNLHLASATASFIGIILFIKGDSLQIVADGIDRQHMIARENKYVISDNFLNEMSDWIKVLSNPSKQISWDLPEFTNDPSAIIVHHTFRLQMTYLFKDKYEALQIIEKMDKLVDDTLVLVVVPEYFFYYCLWMAKLMKSKFISKKEGMKRINKKVVKLKQWAKHSPENYLHQYLLVKAEIESVHKISQEATHLYRRAILLAEENGFLHDTATANECAAHYYLAEGLPKSAQAYMADAYLYYLKWGANRIAANLLNEYPNLIKQSENRIIIPSIENESLNLHAVFQVAAVISSEINFDQLVMKIMNTLLTYGGAERVCLMLSQKNKLQIVADNDINGDVHVYQHRKDIDKQKHLPVTIIDYVARSHDNLVLGHACQEGDFIRDGYISDNRVKSILCLPILNQRKLTGILYLENNQVSNAFTKDIIDLLILLASQVAISIENTYLYSNLEAEVKKRTSSLNLVNKDLMDANHLLAQSRQERIDLLANISHDLRSPISTVRGYVDAILDGLIDDPEQLQSYLTVIKGRLGSLNVLIQDLFELAQLELGNSRFSMDVIPIDQLFTHLCSQFEVEIREANLDYLWNLPSSTDGKFPLVEVDVARIEQVFMNLVTNAIKYTKEGSITISLSLEGDSQAIISVEDEGQGIPSLELPYIFDRFYTKKRKSQSQGYGLGLVISKEIIAHHQGEISVTSEEERGTKFSVSLPIFDID